MFLDVAEPFDARGAQGDVGVQAFGDRVTDDGLTFLLQQLNQPPLLRHQLVDLCGFGIKKRGNDPLLIERGHGKHDRFQ